MADPQIEKLLIVQDRDLALQRIEHELTGIPLERTRLEVLIQTEKDNIEAASHSLKEKEVQRSELDHAVKAKEATVTRFKNQQLEVKKNDEYRALTQQIDQAEAEIAQLEENEIGLMLEIDQAKEAFQTRKKEIEARITEQRVEIQQLNAQQQSLQDSVAAAQEALAQSRVGVESSYLEHYDRVKKMTRRPPYVAQIEDHKCGGCHLRVSNEVSRSAMNSGAAHFCDQCARMVYA